MSAHVLLYLLDKLRKRDKMRGLPNILSLLRQEFNKLNNTGSTNVKFYLSDNIKITLKSHFWCQNVKILPFFMQHYNGQQYLFV